jgi:hypothetical protein
MGVVRRGMQLTAEYQPVSQHNSFMRREERGRVIGRGAWQPGLSKAMDGQACRACVLASCAV